MAVQVEKLIATLEARIDKYEKSLAKAAGTTDRTFKRIEQRGNLLESRLARIGTSGFKGLATGAMSSLAPILSVAAAIQGAKDAMQQFGDVADNAKAAGLDPELFQSLAHQAQLGGVAFNELSGALATFSKNSALAVVGKGKMTNALKALNPELVENIRSATSQEQRIKLVADALQQEADASKRAAIATAAFGDAGAKLADVFAGGSAQIESMRVKAQDLGIIVSRELIARADELGDEFDTAAQIVDLQLKQAFVNLAPILVWLTGLAGDFAKTVNGMVDATKPLEQQSSATIEAQLKALQAAGQQQGPFGLTDVFGVDKAKREELMAELRRRAIDNLRTQLTNPAPKTQEIPTLDELAAGVRKAADEVKKANPEFEAMQKHLEEMQSLAKGFVQGFVSDLMNGTSAVEALQHALGNLASQLTSMALDNAISSLFAGLFGTGGIGGLKSLPGMGGLKGSVKQRASGGPVSAGRPYVVGERQAELFVPHTAGRIVPRIGGGGSEIVTVNLRADAGLIADIADQQIKTASGTIVRIAVGASDQHFQQKAARGSYRSVGVGPGTRRT